MTRHTHIIGIGGAGMSPVATLLHECGEHVSGCDRAPSAALAALEARGVTTCIGHAASHLATADRVLITSALPASHPELVAAHAQGLPVLTRHDIWREWSQQRPILAVTGTHGKTTTTAMLALILERAGIQPGYLIGAHVPALGGSARWSRGPLVLEADEYARTFLALTPQVAVLTNLDWDHVDVYPTQADYDAAFREFASKPGVAAVVACGDDPGLRRVCGDLPLIWCGLDSMNSWQARNLHADGQGTRFDVVHNASPLAQVQLAVSGEHNVRNALLALAAAATQGVDVAQAAAALAEFGGSQRRFELKGEANGVLVIDDYAHHPTEVRATLEAARSRFGAGRRLIAYFQPHTFSRLVAFEQEFLGAFAAADVVRIGAVYGAREAASSDPTPALAAAMAHADAAAVGDLDAAVAALNALLRPGDVLLTMGAGDGVSVGERILLTQEAR